MHFISPKYSVFPLVDTPFNRAKSNIAYLEAIMCGAIIVAPDWQEWRHPGVINYTDDFKEKVGYMVTMEEGERVKTWQAGYENILAKFTLNHLKRSELIDNFLVR